MAQSSAYGRSTDPGSETRNEPQDPFNRAASRAENVANKVAEQGRDAGERMQEVAGNLKGAIDKSITDQPMATLATAAVFGFVLGALWKS
jgi:ElaB/YqjD/DUF883 family membrane-anchored ribosome-binding protein